MPDTLVGAIIDADDFPAAAGASDTTAINNITDTSFVAGSPQVSVTFRAPTSGAILLSVGLSARDNGGTNAIHLAPELRENDVSGAVNLAANVVTRGIGLPGEASNFAYRSRTTIRTGLTPGQVYFARCMHKVSSGTTADLQLRQITVCPAPLGSSFAGRPVQALDYPPVAWAQDTTAIDNPSNTSYSAGSPQVSVTFVAPTSGRVLLVVGGGLGNSAGADRVFLSPEVRLTNSSGALVLNASVTSHGIASDKAASRFCYGSRESVLEGLIPGQVYFARVMHTVVTSETGATSGDIAARDIGVVPLP
ncbi:hypothetical protein [Spongiactinospora sp. TRM90649]|uniref:hypothetical protein n=1 Tax=Spongiactinospora sp. TRM90649 TaxID=3031114 RepID=UPI0023F8C68C|nr:hypothetical protein [Spongiactinospora sp. TRM90649]MDF5758625.1 hypothetical protein [Spongiactinospora sp. TRM90649]